MTDPTNHQQLKAELKEAQEERDRFFELSLDILCIADQDGYFKRVNSAFANALGYSKEELLSRPVLSFVHPDDREATTAGFKTLDRAELISHFENRYLCRDGSFRWLAWSATPFGSRIFGVAKDVTELKRRQAELELSESRFRKLFEESPIAMSIITPQGGISDVNRAWNGIWHFSESAIRDYFLKEYNALQDPNLESGDLLKYLKRAIAGETLAFPLRTYDPPVELGVSGRVRTIESFAYPIKDSNGAVREVIMMDWDVTERIQSEKTMKLLAETGELLAMSLDPKATLERIAEIAIRWLGDCCAIHLMGANGLPVQVALRCVDPARVEALRGLWSRGASDASDGLEVDHVFKTGLSRLVSKVGDDSRSKAIHDAGITSLISVPMKFQNRVIGVISVQSLSRHFNEQDSLLTQELASRAAFAIQNASLYTEAQKAIRLRDDFLAVASHELRTPLTSLNLQVQSIQRVLEKRTSGEYTAEKMLEMLETSKGQLQDLTEFIEGLLDFTRFSGGHLSLRVEEFDLSRLVREVAEKFSMRPETSDCRFALSAPEPVVGRWDRFRIEQVITNLLSNAMKYGEGRPVEIHVGRDDDRAVLSVRDFGIGIAKENHERVFNRFERAVPGSSFRGMGLGLYITKEIVMLHGGTISIESELGRGAVFTVTLPLSR